MVQENLPKFMESHYRIVVSKGTRGGTHLVCDQRDHPQRLQEGGRMISVRRDSDTSGCDIAMNVNKLITVHMTVKEAKQLVNDLNTLIKEVRK